MNKARREKLMEIMKELADLVSRIESIQEEEQDYLDAMPDSFRDGDKGQKAEATIEAMSSAIESIEAAGSELNEAVN
ncbi:hypothetical protein [Hydrocarboniphaga effusa]|uniref:hypothetical protein n=1 Tax=Hydrocarboniphaga effusa TaxID=243629 RepID=UPI003BAD084B